MGSHLLSLSRTYRTYIKQALRLVNCVATARGCTKAKDKAWAIGLRQQKP